MSVRVICPTCGEMLGVEERLLKTRVRCGGCRALFVPFDAEFDDTVPDAFPEAGDRHAGQAVASLVLGCVGLIAWCLPILGLPVTITGLTLGVVGLSSRQRGLAVTGVVLSMLGLALSVANAAVGAYLGATGQHPLLRR